jgi:UDP-N-acetylmuramyl pentapeptide phosphotransferase/UDP-N-acetylglucosamine-1-phosphate transferase
MNALLTEIGMAFAVAFSVGIFASSWIITRWITACLVRRAILDHPNARSSHVTPTPRGGGLAVLIILIPLIAIINWHYDPTNNAVWAMLAGVVLLAVISWIDDLGHLSVLLRLAGHGVAVAVVLTMIPENHLLLQGHLPLWADRILTGIAWVWFINLFNFMDGIDGLAGTETVMIGLGVFIIMLVIGSDGGKPAIAMALIALALAAATGGFLVLNWSPARVFLGDVGSVPLGFITGWMLLMLAMWGYWLAALILPAYYLADATLTIVRRAMNKAPIWKAHSEHFYQHAVQRGFSHARVTLFILRGNIMLFALALTSAQVVNWIGDILCLTGAVAIVIIMLVWMAHAQPDGEAQK